ncbi:MAG TPA: zinc ribbon domain-containing protein [Nevskia sp.]|nr:zinc ribbon domain-containing protein [Nevskia sp.]
MPFYEYLCTHCGAATELLQKLSDPPATTCPKCHAEALTKQISAAGFRLKGGGWYETDFKSDGQRNLVKSGEGATADAAKAPADAGHTCGAGCSHGAKAEAKSETKAEAKAESKPSAPPTTPAATTPAA